ncbi:MAG TPA: glutathione S-transferase family protein [Burkholderiales bacterium]|nr:glutathione S-transferase family protein [Burkholderiales bacterium]
MALTFYYGSGSPYAWRVWLALEHKAIGYELKTISFSAGDLKKPEFLKINPRQKVPAITDGDLALYESAAIVEYLDEQYASRKQLIPGNTKQRAVIRRLVREADEYCAHALERLVDQVLFTPQDKWNAGEIASARTALERELGIFEGYLSGDYLAGELSAADITLYPMIALCLRMEKKKPDLDVRSAIGPKLGAWMKRIEALPYFDKTYPPHWKAKP